MVTGVLDREELIKAAGMAKPTAKLGEKFQYQNVMYAAAVLRIVDLKFDVDIPETAFRKPAMAATEKNK